MTRQPSENKCVSHTHTHAHTGAHVHKCSFLQGWHFLRGSQFLRCFSNCGLSPINGRRGGFPGGAVVESLPANAGDAGLRPGLGGSHMPRSNWAREPQLLSLRVWSLCPATGEAATVRGPRTAMKVAPLAATGESPRTQTKTQHSQK